MTGREYLFFVQGALRCAVPMDEVEAVLSDGIYAPVPGVQPPLWGVCYREGRLYPAVRLEQTGTPVLGVLWRQNDIAAVLFADRVVGIRPLPPQATREAAPGIGMALQEEDRTLWLPQLAELTAGGAVWSGQMG